MLDPTRDASQSFAAEDFPSHRKWTLDIGRSALRHIHPRCDYDIWRRVVSALQTEFSKDNPETLRLVHDWSSGRIAGIEVEMAPNEPGISSMYYPEKVDEGYQKCDPGYATMGSVEYLAKQGGWKPDAELLERLHAMERIHATDDKTRDELVKVLVDEVARARPGLGVKDDCLKELKRITEVNLGSLKERVKEIERGLPSGANDGRPPSHADVLVALGRKMKELWRDTDPQPELFATVDHGDHVEYLPLYGKKFRLHLTGEFNKATGKSPGLDSIKQALNMLASDAMKGPAYPVALRVGEHEGKLYLDLADEKRTVIEIDDNGWRQVSPSPVRFIQRAGMPLPMPEHGGNIHDLKKLINVSDEDNLMLLVGWDVAALRPSYAYTILILIGQHGSAKTTGCLNAKRLIDPCEVDVRGLPRNEDDLLVTARSNHIIVADNLSGIGAEMADALCRLATGGGIGKREHYENGEEYAIKAKRPIILNGINIPTSRPDLLDRALIIQLRPIADNEREEEEIMEKRFKDLQPHLLGALLDGVSMALATKPKLKLDRLPRMADFAKFAAASMPAFGWKPEQFLAAYEKKITTTMIDAGESDAVLVAIVEYVQNTKKFEGIATDLLSRLNGIRVNEILDLNWVRNNRWPTDGSQLSRRINRGVSALRAMGVGFQEAHTVLKRTIQLWRLSEGEPTQDPAPWQAQQADKPEMTESDRRKRMIAFEDAARGGGREIAAMIRRDKATRAAAYRRSPVRKKSALARY